MAVFPHAGRAMGMAVAMIALVVATPMATGVVSARMITDLGMSEAELGQGTSLFWLATACSALLVAPQADRIGWPRAAGVGLAVTAVAQFGLGVLNHSAGSYFVWMVIAGIAYGLVTPASNLTVVQDIPPGRRGLGGGHQTGGGAARWDVHRLDSTGAHPVAWVAVGVHRCGRDDGSRSPGVVHEFDSSNA